MEKIGSAGAVSIDLMVQGFKAAGISAGIKKTDKKDLALIISDVPAEVAAMFTTNKVKAAPVLLDIERAKKGRSYGIIVNSGNANACTGKKGMKDALAMAGAAEKTLGLKAGSLMVASTGVIGVPFPVEKVASAAPVLVESLRYDGLNDAAEAIMTTDAFPKKAMATARINGATITVAGIAKGAGMICPNMATMLAFLMTDAKIKAATLKKALKIVTERSFNSIVVDNDISTNDTVMAFANGLSGAREIKDNTPGFRAFTRLLSDAATKLAHMIVRDGEGATRFIEIDLTGAKTEADARKAAKTTAESMLVKTAFFGGDPNWGRIVAAIGRSGIAFDESKVDVVFNGVPVVKGGLDTNKETEAAEAIKSKEVTVKINLRLGKASWKVWTTDLSYEYVRINSAYRT